MKTYTVTFRNAQGTTVEFVADNVYTRDEAVQRAELAMLCVSSTEGYIVTGVRNVDWANA